MNIQSIVHHLEKREQIFSLLSQLTTTVVFEQSRFNSIIHSLPNNHNIYVYLKDNKIVGMITLFIEQKLIHNGAAVAHIEDLVVDNEYQKQGIARELIEHCLSQLQTNTCYKVILDCKSDLVPFYEKLGFKETNVQMSKYF